MSDYNKIPIFHLHTSRKRLFQIDFLVHCAHKIWFLVVDSEVMRCQFIIRHKVPETGSSQKNRIQISR